MIVLARMRQNQGCDRGEKIDLLCSCISRLVAIRVKSPITDLDCSRRKNVHHESPALKCLS